MYRDTLIICVFIFKFEVQVFWAYKFIITHNVDF